MAALLLNAALVAAFLVVAAYIYQSGSSTQRLDLKQMGLSPGFFFQNLRAAKAKFQAHGRSMILAAYRRDPHCSYSVQTQNMKALVISPDHLPELRKLPLSDLSHAHAMVEKILGNLCGIEVMTQSRLHADVCRINLTRNLNEFFPGMHASFEAASKGFLGQFPPGVPVPAFGFIFTLIMAITSRVMVGEELSMDPAWQGIVSAYLGEVIHTAKSLRPYPKALRSWVRPFVAPKQKVEKVLADADKLLNDPILARQKGDNADPDVMKFIVQGSPAPVRPRTVILQMLVLMSASLYVSCMAATEALYDLVDKPEYLGPLRSEVKAALEAEDGWTYNTIKRLPLLDSFLKESFRYNQPEALGFLRVALKDIELANGLKIPKGSFIGLPAAAMSRDAKYYPAPDVFDGRRFMPAEVDMNAVAKSNQSTEHEFAGIEPGNVGWGSGRSTCPGRWFASAMNKLIIAGLINQCNIDFPGDQKRRPISVEDNGGLIPSMTQGLVFKTLQ